MKKYLLVLMVVGSGALRAQSGEVWLSTGLSLLSNTDIGSPLSNGSSSDVHLGTAGFRIGLRFTYNSAGRLGHEVQYGYNHTSLADRTGLFLQTPGTAGTGINQFGYNLLYYFNATSDEAKVRPFITGGVMADDFVMPYKAINRNNGDSWRPGINYGGGIKFKLSPMFAWRFDIRGYDTGQPNWSSLLYKQSAILHQTEATVGLGFYF